MIERVAFTGDAAKGLTGLFNAASPGDTVPADGANSATTFASKTPDQVLRDVNTALRACSPGRWAPRSRTPSFCRIRSCSICRQRRDRLGELHHHRGVDRAE